MVDYNLFPEDICLSIKNILSAPPIEVADEGLNGELTLVEVKPRYIYPEGELVDIEYPSLVMYESSVVPDYSRMEQGDIIEDNLVTNEQGITVQLDHRDRPIPYVVYVDIRSYVKYNQQRDNIRKEIYKRLGAPFKSINVNGVQLISTCINETNLPKKDEEEGQKTICTQWRYKIDTMFDVLPRKTIYTVQQYIVN